MNDKINKSSLAGFILFTRSGKAIARSQEKFDNVKDISEIVDKNELLFLSEELLSFRKSPFILVSTKLGYAIVARKMYEKDRVFTLIFSNLKEKTFLGGASTVSRFEMSMSNQTRDTVQSFASKKDADEFYEFFDLLRETFSFFDNDLRPFRHIYKETIARILVFSKLFGLELDIEKNENFGIIENYYSDYSSSMAITIIMLSFEFLTFDLSVKIKFLPEVEGINVFVYGKRLDSFSEERMSYIEYITGTKNLPFRRTLDGEYYGIETTFRTNTDYSPSVKHPDSEFEYN